MGRENGPISPDTAETKSVDSKLTNAVRDLINSGIIEGNPETGQEYPKEGQFKVAEVLQKLEPTGEFQEIEIDKQGTKLLDGKRQPVRVKKDKLGGITLEFSGKGEAPEVAE